MPKKRLTEEMVKRIKPPAGGKQVDYYDTVMPQLVLRVNYGGAKVWRALYYVKGLDKNGKRISIPTTYKLGRHPHLTLKDAREAARQFHVDPQKALRQAEDGSFGEIAETWIKRHVQANKLRSEPELKRILVQYVYPKWQHRPFLEIRRREVNDLLDYLADNHGLAQADATLAVIRGVMAWYQTRDDNYTSPIVRGMRRNRNGKARERILTHDEIRMVWDTCDQLSRYGALVKILLLTAQRREKVGTMKWTDIADGVWTIASEQREKGNAGALKLPKLALDIINALPRLAGNPHVFGHRRGKPFAAWTQYKPELETKLKAMPHFVLHDLRRTARSLMAEIGIADNIAEQVLGHAIPGIAGVYNRHAYFEEKAEALNRLAARIETIINPPAGDNVLSAAARFSGARTAGKKRARGQQSEGAAL
jgi:integrase